MKKIYLAPTTEVTKIQLQQMIAASPATQTLDPNAEPIEDSDGIGSRRRGGLWDDDED